MGTNIEATSTFGPSNCRKRICDSSDGMSLLPDDILVSILSRLTIKEAARTSVLSSRWRFLWTYFKGKMDFVLEDWQIESDQFVTTVNEILKLHRGTSVQRLRIIFYEVHYSGEDFRSWIEFAAKKRVRMLQIMLGSYASRFYTKPRFLTSFSFKSLRVLVLKFKWVNDEDLEFFLTNCPNLKRLDLADSKRLSNILIPSSSLSLKEFRVVNCKKLRKIVISARNLEIFDYFGLDISIEVKEVLHHLHTVRYAGGGYVASLSEGITKLARSLPLFQLEELSLYTLNVANYFFSDTDHFTLPKLKTLILVIAPCTGIEMLNCIHLLEADPILHTFTVHFFWFCGLREGMRGFDRHRMRRHKCLKVFNIIHFVGLPEVDVQFVKTLIDNVESLEKMIVIPNHDSNWNPILHRMGIPVDCNVDQVFGNGFLPSGTELVIESLEYIEELL